MSTKSFPLTEIEKLPLLTVPEMLLLLVKLVVDRVNLFAAKLLIPPLAVAIILSL